MRDFVQTSDGVVRFKGNAVVRAMSERLTVYEYNRILSADWDPDDLAEFYQLIGYSLRVYHEIDALSDEQCLEATRAAQKVFPGVKGCRDDNCPIHTQGME